jgi:hypothetical protein
VSTSVDPWLSLFFLGVVSLIFLTFVRPLWSLGGIFLFLPFQSIILNWVPSNLLPFVAFISDGLILALALVVLWRIFSHEIALHSLRKDVLILVFLTALILFVWSVAFVHLPWAHFAIALILLLIIFWILAPSKQWVKKMFLGYFVILAFETVLGYCQWFFGSVFQTMFLPMSSASLDPFLSLATSQGMDDFGMRLFGSFGSSEIFGGFLACVLLLLVAVLAQPEVRKSSLRWFVPLFFLALPIFAFSNAWFLWSGFVAGFLFLAVMSRWKRTRAFSPDPLIRALLLGAGAQLFVIIFAICFSSIALGGALLFLILPMLGMIFSLVKRRELSLV